MGGSVVGRRVVYYAAVVVGGVLVHQEIFADLAGAALTDFLRRNSEAYALMVLVPLFWDLFGWAAQPDATDASGPRPRNWWRRAGLVGWTGSMVAAVVVSQSELAESFGLSASVFTLGEAFLAAAVISVYIAWSRAIGVGQPSASGAPLEPWRLRIWYYVAALGLMVAAASQVTTAGDAGIAAWIVRNVEAFTAMVLLPLYFDVVAAARPPGATRVAWYGSMAALPVLMAGSVVENVLPMGLVELLRRSTEAFIAALAISIYFDVWRGRATHLQVGSGGEVANGVVEETIEPADP